MAENTSVTASDDHVTVHKEELPVKANYVRKRSRGVSWLIIFLKVLLSQWQIIWIGIAVIFAWLFPDVGRKGGVIESQYGSLNCIYADANDVQIHCKLRRNRHYIFDFWTEYTYSDTYRQLY